MMNTEKEEERVKVTMNKTPIKKKRVRVKPSQWANLVLKREQVTVMRVIITTRKKERRMGKMEAETSVE